LIYTGQAGKDGRMNAQQQMLEYAKSKMRTDSTLTPAEWCGKMITEGIVIERTPGGMIVANATREGKSITITETTKTEKNEVVDGKLVSTPIETTEEVLRIEL
jgi:hypothetical protein